MTAPERMLPPPPAPLPSAAAEPWHARSAAQTLQAQSVERGAGLSHDEAAARFGATRPLSELLFLAVEAGKAMLRRRGVLGM